MVQRIHTTTHVLDEAIAIAHDMNTAETWLQLGAVMSRRKALQELVEETLEAGYFQDEARDELKLAQALIGTRMDKAYFNAHSRISRIRRGLLTREGS